MQLVYFDPGKTGAALTILSLSLSAVTFPVLSKQVPFIRIPRVVFFIGKHFGTGVILSTAFCHLLEDAFVSLDKPPVKEHYGKIGKCTGLIILSSLLAIFLVEYVSSTYVDYLQADRSTPPTPIETPQPSRPVSVSKYRHRAGPCVPLEEEEEDLLLVPDLNISTNNSSKTSSRRPSRHRGEIPIGLITNSRHRVKCCLLPETCVCSSQRETIFIDGESMVHIKEEREQALLTRNRRQIVGILVLQLGIMIHSLVIGLTLSITQGSDFASLLVAICFHQVFEGLSLGIRIDGLPPASALFLSTQDDTPAPPSESTRLHQPSESYTFMHLHQEPHLKTNWLKTVLSILFAVTTPFGMIVGLYAFPQGGRGDGQPKQRALMLLTQGVMSAVSAGMLIYAATVEMIAADFVFGDVSGGHSHHSGGHGHHGHGAHGARGRGHRVGDIEGGNNGHRDGGSETPLSALPPEDEQKGSTVGQKVLAVVSLLAGVLAMNLTALFE